MKYNKSLFFLLSCNALIISGIPEPDSLKKVYHISEAEDIEFLAFFPEYKDVESYGSLPNYLNSTDLLALNDTVSWNDPCSYGIKSKKDLYVAKINDTFVCSPRLGTIFNKKQQFLFDIVVNPGHPLFWPVEHDVKDFPVIRHKKIATVQGPTYFYHWVIDRLPSVLLLREFLLADPEIKFIINSSDGSVASYVYEYLDLLGIPKEQVITAQANTLYYADMVYFATPFLMEPIPKQLLLTLRNALLEGVQKKKLVSHYKDNLIVVIQRREPRRRIANLDVLLEAIKSKFSDEEYELLVFNGDMSVAQQIDVFTHARLVIGVMGSGLANVLFVNPKTSIIEIHPEFFYSADKAGVNSQGGEFCWWLSSVVRATYWFVLAPFHAFDEEVICPITKINEVLEKIVLKK